MNNRIDKDLMSKLDKIWHYFIFNFQNKKNGFWGEELKDATTIEVSILNLVDNNSDVMLKEIKEILDIPGSTLTSAVDRLEKKELVKRVISKRDRRSFGLVLTEKGKKAQKRHIRAEKELFNNILGALDSKEERKQFLNSLEKIKNYFDKKLKED